MGFIEKLEETMNLKDWPHRFTKDGIGAIIDKDRETGDPIITQPMICLDCHARYVSGRDNRPPDPCPARTKKSEMKRLLS